MTIPSFEFMQCGTILKSTGRSASNLRELRDQISVVTERSIFHHTCEYFLNALSLRYTNDFAHWAGMGLEERALAEHLSTIDPYDAGSVEEVRAALLETIDTYLRDFPEPREVMAGGEFYFNENVVIAFPVGIRARNLAEFLMGMKFVDPPSVYYHFYDARLRLGGNRNDYSEWFEKALGKGELARRVAAIDPFVNTLDRIRTLILQEAEDEVRRDMGSVS